MRTSNNISFNSPTPPAAAEKALHAMKSGESQTAFSVDAQGTGSFSGLAYTVSAHTSGTLDADVSVMAITTEDVAKLNALVMSMLDASAQSKVTEHEKTHASADISIWSMFGGGGGASASYDKTKDTMHSMGLSDAQITTIIDKMFEIAQKMSNVKLNYTIDNTANDYSVSGDLQLYTISGKITTKKGTAEYRLLANKGTAGSGDTTAPAEGKVIPLS